MKAHYRVNIERIENDLYELRKFGFNPEDRGIYRPGLTEIDMQSRRWLMDRFRANGLEARMDGAGNVIGRRGPDGRPAVAVGSHTDTVPCGGMFDGALGVIAGLECIRVLNEQGIETVHPVEVISTSEEEGRFGGMLGAQALRSEEHTSELQSRENLVC